jgi:hypothetical protein
MLFPQQYGFQKGLSREDAIYKQTNVILPASNRKEYGIFYDIAKAFSCVSHELPLMKLQYCGIQGVYQCFISSLQDSRQRVELKYLKNNYYLERELVRCSVSQGLVMVPLLFNIYINK